MADYYLDSSVGSVFQINHAYNLGDRVYATSAATAARKQRVYEVTTAGTTAGAEPAWNTTVGGTTTSNTCVFTTRNPTTWANANGFLNYLTLAVLASGDRIFVKNTHSESIAQPTLLGVGTGSISNPVQILCVSDANEPPTTLATGALVASTGAFALGTGIIYAYGIEFRSGNGSAGANNITVQAASSSFESCTFNLASSAASIMFPTTSANVALYINCTFTFGVAGDNLSMGASSGGWVIFRNGLMTGTAPTNAIVIQNGAVGQTVILDGMDCSLVTGTLIAQSLGAGLKNVKLRNVKVGAGCTIFGGSRDTNWQDELHELASLVDSGGTNYKINQTSNVGDLTAETTIVRTGGASDGMTSLSWKIVTTANAQRIPGLYHTSPWIGFWNEAVGVPVTVALEIIHDSLTNLKDNEVWIEVMYLASSGSPAAAMATDAADALAAGADQAASSSTWTTTGLTNPNKQVCSVDVTPQMKGVIRARLCVAKASKTLYVDPFPLGSGVSNISRQFQASFDAISESGFSSGPPLIVAVGDGMVPQAH